MMTYTIFCKLPGQEFAQIVGSSGNLTNARKIAMDYAKHYGHAHIRMRDSVDYNDELSDPKGFKKER